MTKEQFWRIIEDVNAVSQNHDQETVWTRIVENLSHYQKEHMEMEYARHFLRALKLLEEAQRGNEDPDTLINGLLQAATEFYDADSHILSKRIGRQALA